jgi:hypothetical protein
MSTVLPEPEEAVGRAQPGADKLVKALNRPKDGVHARLRNGSRTADEGNHRIHVLLELAEGGYIPWDTPVFVGGPG